MFFWNTDEQAVSLIPAHEVMALLLGCHYSGCFLTHSRDHGAVARLNMRSKLQVQVLLLGYHIEKYHVSCAATQPPFPIYQIYILVHTLLPLRLIL